MYATHNNGNWPPIVVTTTETEILVQLLYRIQGFPTLAVRCEGKAAIGDGCLDPWVTLQSDRKQIDLVLD